MQRSLTDYESCVGLPVSGGLVWGSNCQVRQKAIDPWRQQRHFSELGTSGEGQQRRCLSKCWARATLSASKSRILTNWLDWIWATIQARTGAADRDSENLVWGAASTTGAIAGRGGKQTKYKGPEIAGVNVMGAVVEGNDAGLAAVLKTATMNRAGGRPPSRGANL